MQGESFICQLYPFEEGFFSVPHDPGSHISLKGTADFTAGIHLFGFLCSTIYWIKYYFQAHVDLYPSF